MNLVVSFFKYYPTKFNMLKYMYIKKKQMKIIQNGLFIKVI